MTPPRGFTADFHLLERGLSKIVFAEKRGVLVFFILTQITPVAKNSIYKALCVLRLFFSFFF